MGAGRGREQARRWAARAFLSVRGRATVISVVGAGVTLLVCMVLTLQLLESAGENAAERHARKTLQRVAFDITTRGIATPVRPEAGEAQLIQMVEPSGRVIAASASLRGRPSLNPVAPRISDLLISDRVCPSYLKECVHLVGLRVGGRAYPRTVMLYAAEPVPLPLSTPLLYLEAAVVLLVLTALVGWWTWWTIGNALRPVEAIRRELAEITATDLDRRVPEPHTGGELQRMAVTVNDTLERLQQATSRERRFVSDASHDLRNPIAGLHTRLEVALDEPDSFDWKPTVRAALRDTERLNEIVADLLELSRLDARSPALVEVIDLAELVERETVRHPRHPPVVTRLEPRVLVRANAVRLGRLLGNLLSNAERHADSQIEVVVAEGGGQAVLEVRDDGAGIPAEERERVFERFARLPESQRRDPGGTGLGLPIAREIAEIYGGTLIIAESTKGARFVLRLPLASP
ncbi:HAMP domain-containing histidine kinase [Actinomadura barringtoniae]|uniref:histidine kinase n=1 Tax=Actinomadura barringtoniae TaxID=1427535 RepID=A0A939PKM0_9ACTN|nr:HAMP domain-containing sensor histidine kinase [Actinomadura barringtoniae]MBO2450904.1 HAMP domain-containing histidine kinase [Actinomadura barringtoniae]